MRRRVAALSIVVGALCLGGAPAGADAPAGSNNCAGAFASGLMPALAATDAPSFGQSRSEAAQAGTVGPSEREFTDLLASCGTP